MRFRHRSIQGLLWNGGPRKHEIKLCRQNGAAWLTGSSIIYEIVMPASAIIGLIDCVLGRRSYLPVRTVIQM